MDYIFPFFQILFVSCLLNQITFLDLVEIEDSRFRGHDGDMYGLWVHIVFRQIFYFENI